jgi:hypothetical protein
VNNQSQYLLQSIKGPVIMITIGVLFAADRFTGYHFHQTWPVLLIVVGLLQLVAGRWRPRADYYPPPTGSRQSYPPPPVVPPVVPTPAATPAPPSPIHTDEEEPRS